jgi:lipid II:glycine glycyltransferase (peptidoglycan interpeptide bridge formation enzyme)
VSNYLFVDLQEEIDFSPKKTVGYRNGKFDGFRIQRDHDFKSFWEEVLVPSLNVRHDAAPVHNLEEIELLASRFPKKIIQHNLYRENKLLAGITFFIKGTIIKSQYAASTALGMKTDAVGYLYMEAMKEYKKLGFHFMDLGPVNEDNGSINKGLLRFKKQLGGKMQEVMRLVKTYK